MADLDLSDVDLAARYDEISDPQFAHGRDLIDLLALTPHDRVVDIGCGTGRLAALAASHLEKGRVVGIDPDPSRIDVAQRRCTQKLEFRVGHAEDLSAFKPEKFDAAYMNSVFNWLRDPSRALVETHRVLKRGGRLGIATTLRDRPNELWHVVRQARDVASGLAPEEIAGRTARRNAKKGVSSVEVGELLQRAAFEIRFFERRTYLSSFESAAQIFDFLLASTHGDLIPGATHADRERFRAALELVIAQLVPERRRRSGIQLERHVLLAVADRVV